MFHIARPRSGLSRPVAALLAALAALSPRVATAFDPFEIQVYNGSTNDPGTASLELHTNHSLAPHRRASPPELSWHRQTHATFEPALGITPFWELGAYFQLAGTGDGTIYWAGTKLRTKLVTPDGWHPHLTLGLNIEFAFISERFDADRYGGELRPIVAWDDRYFQVAANPNIEFALAGEGMSEGPELNPAVAACVKIPDIVSLGVEYYASMGPFAELTPSRQQEHYLFGAANVLAWSDWAINFGVGAGLTPASNDFIVKAIFGHAIGQLWGPTTPALAKASPPAPSPR
jgi:hypothetical protein